MFRNLSPGAIGLRCTLEEALKLAPLGGFQGVDAEVAALQQWGGPKEAAKRFADAGLKMGGFGLPVEWNADLSQYQQSLQALGPLAEYAAAAGCTRTCTWVPSWCDLPYEQAFDWHVERFRPIAQVLKYHGCRLGLEFLGPKTLRAGRKHEFISTMSCMLGLCRSIGDNVGLLLDAWHWYTSHGTLEELRQLTDADVVYIPINDAPKGVPIDEHIDSVRRLPGETGVIDLVGFLRALHDIGCTAPVTPEPFVARLAQLPPEEAVRTVGDALMRVWQPAGLP
jgi:sugar phosphate isomerase/epimerase